MLSQYALFSLFQCDLENFPFYVIFPFKNLTTPVLRIRSIFSGSGSRSADPVLKIRIRILLSTYMFLMFSKINIFFGIFSPNLNIIRHLKCLFTKNFFFAHWIALDKKTLRSRGKILLPGGLPGGIPVVGETKKCGKLFFIKLFKLVDK